MNTPTESKNRGAFYERTEHNPLEKAFADQWEKENEEVAYVNCGKGILQDLFMDPDPTFGYMCAIMRHKVTDGERYVASTVVQWLGTNVGMCFLREALAKDGWKIVKAK